MHRDHDEQLIVRVASNDAAPVDKQLAQRQLAGCEDCRALFADVTAIRAATVADVLRVPPRPRSFRIPPEELERLRTPAWRRWLGRLGAPSFDLIRPLGTVVAGLGLAVAVLGSGFGALPGPAALVQSPTTADERELVPNAHGSPTAAPGGAFGAQASPAATAAAAQDGAGKATAAPEAPAAETPPTDLRVRTSTPGGGVPLSLPSLGLAAFVAGLGALLLNTVARRAAGR